MPDAGGKQLPVLRQHVFGAEKPILFQASNRDEKQGDDKGFELGEIMDKIDGLTDILCAFPGESHDHRVAGDPVVIAQ